MAFDFRNINFTNPLTGESINNQINNRNNGGSIGETINNIETTTAANVTIASDSNNGTPIASLADEVVESFKSQAAWDPRLYRVDEYFLTSKDGVNANAMRVPFSSETAATTFADMSNTMEVGVVKALIEHGDIKQDSQLGRLFANLKISDQTSETSNTQENNGGSQQNTMSNSEKVITNPIDKLANDSFNWGVQSIMNPYSLTKLVGGIILQNDGNFVNYMYDIRDHRRFYAMQDNNNFTSVSNPTITELIKWSNSDLWGRTPYSFQDFVYCKYFGLIPNNRLITLRRYAAPTYDNLQFENMYGDQEQTTQDASGNKQTETQNNLPESNDLAHGTFAPISYVVTWFGGETGNSLNSLMSFSTGINWGEVKSDIWEVNGEEGESKQAVIDKFLGDGDHSGLFRDAELSSINSIQHPLSKLTAKITSLGKFNLALNGGVGISQDAYDKIAGANVDPFDSTFRNRIKGPINRIDAVKKREAGIKFSQTLNIKCSYKAKAIGGINPKAALLDVLGNCLEMVSPHAIFWGGGHRFMVKPQIYPFHDGGWRDSFMARVYDGKLLGKDGAIATVMSGFTKVGKNEDGSFNFDTMKDSLGRILGNGLGLLGEAISSLSNMFGGVDFLTNASDKLFGGAANASGQSEADVRKNAKNKKRGLLSSLEQMWHNRMLANTMMPNINAGGNILIGEPVGEWHLTIGNPLNPIMVIGNLICSEMKVSWDEELGPDDFPEGFSVDYTLEHAMARDSDAIQSMFNRGMGKFYALPDYIQTSSEQTTWVDKYTQNVGGGVTGTLPYKNSGALMKNYGTGYKTYRIDNGTPNKMAGTYNTTLITKFNPINTQAMRSVNDRQLGNAVRSENVISHIKSLAATRKLTNN